ncbi:hypothetical protein [Microlunatus flavus]|uniref:Uncharacterized protein n=1 Tax=Microlunatus flavus TaxID=1036181 RepID=A0A1H9LUE8_9ACTN|nr:hypothetical protein [Microlunatus flavus]SER14785.1 hypothetical protein SAMN05421756_109110 [Microlunatus flavus]
MTPNASGRANRVAPDGSLHAVAARGILWGNRGALLDERGRLARHARGLGWVCCVLEFHGRHRDQWRPGRLTELYVLDEPTALAAGHRPCGECRSADHRRFREAWTQTFPADTTAALVDRRLHAARLVAPGVHRTYEAPLATLPDGTLVEHDDGAWLVAGKRVLRWSFEGYGEPLVRESLPGIVTVRTPAPTVAALAAGYVPLLHPSALRAAD